MNAQLVRVAMETDASAGLWTRVDWDGRNGEGQLVSAGVYFVSIQGAGIQKILPVVVMKQGPGRSPGEVVTAGCERLRGVRVGPSEPSK